MDQETSLSEKQPQKSHQSHPLPLKLDDHPNAEKMRVAVNIPKKLDKLLLLKYKYHAMSISISCFFKQPQTWTREQQFIMKFGKREHNQ